LTWKVISETVQTWSWLRNILFQSVNLFMYEANWGTVFWWHTLEDVFPHIFHTYFNSECWYKINDGQNRPDSKLSGAFIWEFHKLVGKNKIGHEQTSYISLDNTKMPRLFDRR